MPTIRRTCQVTNVQSHHRLPRSAVAIATFDFLVYATASHTVPTLATGVLKPLCCRLTPTFTLTSVILSWYTFLCLYWSHYNYAAHVADILTQITAVLGVDNHGWGSCCRHSYRICTCLACFSWIFYLSRWLDQLSKVPAKVMSLHTCYTFTPRMVTPPPPPPPPAPPPPPHTHTHTPHTHTTHTHTH